jgi:hypothetical protein
MTNEQRPPIVIGMTTTYDQCQEFLQRLAREPEFRSEVENDPRTVLGNYGIVMSHFPEVVHLAPEEEIESFLTSLDEKMQLGGPKPEMLGYSVLYHSLAAFAMPVVAPREHELDRAG